MRTPSIRRCCRCASRPRLNRIAPAGTPRHFIVNTGAEAVENAIKAVLLNRVKTTEDAEGGFIVSFEGAFHGRTLGSLAVTHRKKARLGFPTFDWPHIPFPVEEARAPKETLRREERSLKQLWDLLVSGRLPHAEKSRDTFRREMDAIDEFLAQPGPATSTPSSRRSARLLTADVVRRSRRVAAVLVEPIQGEGGVRIASARFMRKLRLLTRIYDVPLIFDEVQTGWGMTGRLWAHELFDLPCPPDLVTWAKKAQNGVLFVSEALATFFQEEKKFNTTWEGDSVGMVRLLALLDKLDLEQVRRTGDRARAGLEALARDYREILKNVRGAGVMLGFDVQRADLCDALLDRAFRRGLVLLPAGERSVRLLSALRHRAVGDRRGAVDPARSRSRTVGGRAAGDVGAAAEDPRRHAGDPARHRRGGRSHAGEFRGAQAADPRGRAGALRRGRGVSARRAARRAAAAAAVPARDARSDDGESARASASALRDRVSGRFVGYALGSALENHDEEGVGSDPRFGENNTFYLQAMATLPTVQNAVELENYLLEALRDRAARGRIPVPVDADRGAAARNRSGVAARARRCCERIDNYLRSGITFVYLQVPLRAVNP